ncbi:MAG: hypothetical protein ABIB79_00385 [archaeon]
MKKRVGFFSFTCCEGCTIVFIEALNQKYDEWTEKVEFVNFRALKKIAEIQDLDIAFVEGAISTPHEAEKLKEIRKKSKILIALGSGASNGYPSDQRNKFTPAKKKQIAELIETLGQTKTIESLEKYVKVDDKIDGCPVDEKVLIAKVEGLIK